MGFNFDGQKSFAIFVANVNCIIKLIIRNKFRDEIHKNAQRNTFLVDIFVVRIRSYVIHLKKTKAKTKMRQEQLTLTEFEI